MNNRFCHAYASIVFMSVISLLMSIPFVAARGAEASNLKEGAAVMVNVTEYGAHPNDGNDDTQGILDALEECRKHESPVLHFAPGRYRLKAGANKARPDVCFPVSNLNNLTIQGNGALLLVDGLTSVFAFGNCRNLKIQGLQFDWERPSFSVGTVMSATDHAFDVKVFDEFPVKGGEPVQAFMDYDPETGLIRPDAADVYYPDARTELIAPQTLRVHLKNPVRMTPGVSVVLRHQVYGYNVFWFGNCDGVTLADATIYTCPGMGVVGDNSKDITIERMKVLIRPGTRRLMSTTADATHFSRCRGLVELKDCYFEGMGDDGGNFKGLYLTTLEKRDDRTVVAQHNLKHNHLPFAGDVIEFVERGTLLPYATGIVKSASNEGSENRHVVQFEEPLPTAFKMGDVLANASRTPRVRIKGCTVRNNRARGFLIQTRDAIVEDCTFQHCTSGGIFIMTEVVYFYESLGTRDVIIRNNRFENCGYSNVGGCECPITVFGYLADFKFPPKPGVHKNITLENNIIQGSRNSGIFVAATDGVIIRNNTIEGVCGKPTRDQYHAAIHIMSSANADISGNNMDPTKQGAAFKIAFEMGPGCDVKSVAYEAK